MVFERKSVSSRHAQLTLTDGGTLQITDLNSTNGTRLDGVRLEANSPVDIVLGQRVSLGRSAQFLLEGVHVEPLYRSAGGPRNPVIIRGATELDRSAAAPSSRSTIALGAVDLLSELQLVARSKDRSEDSSVDRSGTSILPTVSPQAVSISVGYSERCDISIPNPVVSGRHARIYLDEGTFFIEDQTSTNGTFVNGVRVTRAELQLGDSIALGSHSIVFVDEIADQLHERADVRAEGQEAELTLEPGRVIRVGRSAECDIVVTAPVVSSVHATLTVLPNADGYEVRDAGSTNGTFHGSRTNRAEGVVIANADDVIFLGGYRLPLARVPSLLPALAALPDKLVFFVGRDPDRVDIAVDSGVVSARHLEVEVVAEARFKITDLGSANGTFVNGVALHGTMEVTSDDRVSLGGHEVQLDQVHGVVRKEYHGDIMLQAERISVDVSARGEKGKKRILNDVSFSVFPTEFVGLMGPSGAGKTTLMMALAGIMPPSEGRCQLNGLDVYESYDAFRGNIGYVPQDDIVYPQLTVYESLYYTARLRLPADTSDGEIDRKIDEVLAALEITHTRNTKIGDALSKGISGGERKRVNLAQELITEPSLLFLDEPTSGLASQDTINVMRLLRTLANAGKTVLLTIHQPSLEAYRQMDSVIYLFRGNLVYYGPAYPDSILHFNDELPEGPARAALLAEPGNALRPLADDQRDALTSDDPAAALEQVVDKHREKYEASAYNREYVSERASDPGARVPKSSVKRAYRRGWLAQWRVLVRRTALIKWKDRVNSAILLAQAPIIGLVLSMVFAVSGDTTAFDRLDRAPAALFLLVASAIWFGCSNSAREIVGEQAIYGRERMVNLMIPSYVLSKAAVLGVVCALQCALLLGIVYVPLGLTGHFGVLYGILFGTSLVGLGMGLTLSSLVRSEQAAMALIPLILIPQIVLGGVIMPVHQMSAPTQLLAGLTTARWGFEAMLHAEFADDDLAAIQSECEIPECVWGTGATGFSYTYYSGDPEAASETEISGGLEALQGGQVPFAAPLDEPVCQSLCAAVQHGKELTPVDRSFGADPSDPVRVSAVSAIGTEGHAPDLLTTPAPASRTSFWHAMGVLAGLLAFFLGVVMALLRTRDIEMT
ncbi:MAG: ABC-type multidrug transport system ATPase subunit [Bradymonadia bacterium]